ncbi:hypothetical protein HOF56_01130 [Candidatus Peribacteria bacterium]|jgi:SAM-dependent methyltransferase|nr:hypothetical protein [Candidatus Peribacteria bacterium]MBT4020926.1 hypothetical protein [Candidatus Peribacteria bacterium]MBT4240484.1 hypothetical protein [Candidatus Peribacteria bacterium]MBT4474368.1 hypothetical protein [Candidatus Peribacteria bacterium]
MKDDKTPFTPDDIASWDYAQIWNKFPVPARPSKEELEFLEKEISHIPHENLLILGSTIEYRSICKHFGIQPDVADFDQSNYEILTSYSKEKFENENFLATDWLEIDDENKYDIIIGHRAINVVGKEVLQQFFKRMHKALKPGGVFYCKGNILYNNEEECFNELLDKWAFAKNRKHPLFSYIEVNLYFYTADKDGYVVYPETRKVVDQLVADKRCSQEDYNLIKMLVSMSEEARFRGLIHEKEIRDIISNVGFSESEWIVLDKDICQNMPILKLRK